MVGFDPHRTVRLTDQQYVLAGAFSGLLTRAICQPFDVVKVRFQLQIEPIKKSPTSKYYGIAQAFGAIVREERFHGLWKGHIAAQGLSVVFGLAQFSSFELTTRTLTSVVPRCTEYRSITHFVCGCWAGCVATIISQPLDVLRTRLVAQGEPKVYPNMAFAVASMYKHEGIPCFWKGLAPTLMQVAPQTGLQFAFYSLFINAWKVLFSHKTGEKIGGFQSLASGSMAGICAKASVYPLDLVKKRLQVQGFEQARMQFGEVRRYNGMINCLGSMAREEGMMGWYKGLQASLLKSALSVGITFYSYEQACNFFLKYQEKVERDSGR